MNSRKVHIGAQLITNQQNGFATVIGGTGALGAAVAERLAQEGARVAFNYHSSPAKADALIEKIAATGAPAPEAQQVTISDAAAVKAFIDDYAARHGRLDTLVYAAGPTFQLDFVSNIAPQEFSRVIDADLKGCFNAVHAALPHLRETRGSVVAVTAAGVQRAIARDLLSLTPKSAITTLIRHIALEEGRRGVRANCVAPGFIDGGLGTAILENVGADVAQQIVKGIPMRRMGTVEEIADAVSYLASPRASYVTGTTLFVTGGMEL